MSLSPIRHERRFCCPNYPSVTNIAQWHARVASLPDIAHLHFRAMWVDKRQDKLSTEFDSLSSRSQPHCNGRGHPLVTLQVPTTRSVRVGLSRDKYATERSAGLIGVVVGGHGSSWDETADDDFGPDRGHLCRQQCELCLQASWLTSVPVSSDPGGERRQTL